MFVFLPLSAVTKVKALMVEVIGVSCDLQKLNSPKGICWKPLGAAGGAGGTGRG